MERITTIIKDLENYLPEHDLQALRKSLYRSMDVLTELELNLVQMKVEKLSKNTV
jgi:hypothetical protein